MLSDTAYLRNPHDHTAGDTADTLDYARMASTVDGVTNFVMQVAVRKGFCRKPYQTLFSCCAATCVTTPNPPEANSSL